MKTCTKRFVIIVHMEFRIKKRMYISLSYQTKKKNGERETETTAVAAENMVCARARL